MTGTSMSETPRITNRKNENPEPVESIDQIRSRAKDDDEVRTIVEALRSDKAIKEADYDKVLTGLGIPESQYRRFLTPKRPSAPDQTKTSGNYKLNNIRNAEKMFEAPTYVLDLPSKGMFYENGQSTLKVKALTAQEDDILFTPELITMGSGARSKYTQATRYSKRILSVSVGCSARTSSETTTQNGARGSFSTS
jgi:hypothetical protein